MENIPFGDEDVFTTKLKNPEPVMPYQDDAPTPDQSDEYLTIKVLFPRVKGYQQALIMHHKRDLEGNPIRQHNENPLLDTRVYTA